MTQIQTGTGLARIEAEMQRQHADALASFENAQALAAQIAASIRRTGSLTLAAMGGSHCVNRAAAVVYRRCGIEVECEVLSELLITPQPDCARTVLITSQSGNSGEVVALLDQPAGMQERFGLTLDASSALGSRIPSLIGAGGPERAFAATRSILVSHALHLAVLAALGVTPQPALSVLREAASCHHGEALEALRSCSLYVISGRGELQGVAESGALCVMELARVPALGLEGGQLRHGPMEVLSGKAGVIFLRAAGKAASLTPPLAAACRAAGANVVVFDASGEAPAEGAVTVSLPRADGMAAIFSVLPPIQKLLIDIASSHVSNVGEPLRTNKVTTEL